MKPSLAPLLVAGLGLALLPGVSLAGPNIGAKILLHLAPPVTKNTCINSRIPTCNDVVTNGSVNSAAYFAYLLVADGFAPAGIGGLQCGITYPGGTGGGSNTPINVFSWTLCATLEFTSTGWPAPGGGNLMTWDTNTKCQRYEPGGPGTGVFAAAGYFYLAAYGPGRMAVTNRPVDGLGKVADCMSNEDIIASGTNDLNLGYLEFSAGGVTQGYRPCGFYRDYCHLIGPASVGAGQTGLIYTVGPGEATQAGYWLILGNGVIESSDNVSATVRATGPGTFNIGYQVGTGCVEGCGCGLNVSVLAPTAVEPASWSHIKAMYPGSRPPGKPAPSTGTP